MARKHEPIRPGQRGASPGAATPVKPLKSPNRHLELLKKQADDRSYPQLRDFDVAMLRNHLEQELAGYPEERTNVARENLEPLIRDLAQSAADYRGAADQLDVKESGIGAKLFAMIGVPLVFIFDVVILTATFFFVGKAVMSQGAFPTPDLQIASVAWIPALGVGIGLKILAERAVTNRALLPLYMLSWVLIAAADLFYLFNHGASGVGLAMTAAMTAAATVTYGVAHYKHHSPDSLKVRIARYRQAYIRYNELTARWLNVLEKLSDGRSHGSDQEMRTLLQSVRRWVHPSGTQEA